MPDLKIMKDTVRPELDTLADIAELWAKGRDAGRQSHVIREMLIKQCEVVVSSVLISQQAPGDE